jgi:hypothetical protein
MFSDVIDRLVKSLSNIFKVDISRDQVEKDLLDSYDQGVSDMEVKFNMNFAGNKDKLQFLEQYTFDNIKGMNDELADKLRKELSIGLVNNESISKIKDRIRGVMEIGVNRASMIARTEISRVANTGRLDAANEAKRTIGAESVKW